MKAMTHMEFHDKEIENTMSGARIVNGVIFSPSENYLTRISDWGSEDESNRSLEFITAVPLESNPFSHSDDFQTRPLSAKDEEDDEDWDEDEDWDDEDDEDWDEDEDEDEDEE